MANYQIKTLTIASGEAVSNGVMIPRNHSTVTIFTPASLAVLSKVQPYEIPTWKLQLSPGDTGDSSTDVWYDAYTFDSTVVNADGTRPAIQLAFPYEAQQALSFPASYLGTGVVRISTYQTTQTAAVAWTIMFGAFHN